MSQKDKKTQGVETPQTEKKEEPKIGLERFARQVGMRKRDVITAKRMYKNKMLTLQQWKLFVRGKFNINE